MDRVSLETTGDVAVPRAGNRVTALRPDEDCGAEDGGGVTRTWKRKGLSQEG